MMVKTILSSSEIFTKLLRCYSFSLPPQSVIQTQELPQGYMNRVLTFLIKPENRKYVLIIYNANRYSTKQAQRRLFETHKVANYIQESGLPARQAVPNIKKEILTPIKFHDKTRLVAVYNYLPGHTIPWEAYTRRHLRSLGRLMKEMHTTLKDYPQKLSLLHWRNYFTQDNEKILAYINKNKSTIMKKLAWQLNSSSWHYLTKDLGAINGPEQLIHYDLVRGNVLFSSKKRKYFYPITGILDFEKVMYAPVEIDLARTLSFLLVDCKHKEDEAVVGYFLRQGYNYSKEISRLKPAMLYFWMRDMWKLLTCNPYEDLVQNFHYQATKKRLLRNNIIQSSL